MAKSDSESAFEMGEIETTAEKEKRKEEERKKKEAANQIPPFGSGSSQAPHPKDASRKTISTYISFANTSSRNKSVNANEDKKFGLEHFTTSDSDSDSPPEETDDKDTTSPSCFSACFRFAAIDALLSPIKDFKDDHTTAFNIGCTVAITLGIVGALVLLTTFTFGAVPAAVAMASSAAIAWHAIAGGVTTAAVVAGPAIAHAATTAGATIAAHKVAVGAGVGTFSLAGLCTWGFLRHKKNASDPLPPLQQKEKYIAYQ